MLKTPKHAFRVVETSGHTRNHLVFHEAEMGWLFVGDFFLTSKPVVIFLDNNLTTTMASLEKLLKLDFDVLFCAHSGVLRRGRALLAEELQYLRELQGKVGVMREMGMDDRAIDRALFKRRRLLAFGTGGQWSSLNMVRTL